MLSVLRHRGPNSQRLVRRNRGILANSRLDIIDISDNASLPMSNEDGTIWLAYNGEVTNFRSLSEKFGLHDRHRFRSMSDAEVLIHLYEDLGIGFLQHLSGYFAFCLYDERAGKAFVVRDFFGARPLFYTTRENRLYFGSEIKALLEIPGLDRALDREGFFHFFTLAYLPVPRTPFRDIRELDGGHLIEIDLATGHFVEREYYKIDYRPESGLDERDVVKGLREVLQASVERNLISDVPVGLALSGGVDSSSLLMLAKNQGHELHTFSVEMADPSFNEREFQRIIVEHGKPIHHRVMIGPQTVLNHLAEHMAFLDEPTGDGAVIPFFVLAREARPYVKVLLSGEGGDEVFNAYETQRACRMRRGYRRWVPRPLRYLVQKTAESLPVSHRKLSFDFVSKRFTQGAELGVPEAHIYWRHCLIDQDIRNLVPGSANIPSTGSMFRELYDSLDFEDEHDRISWLDLKQYFIGDLMVKNDRMAMANSIEARYPFIDREVVEFSHRLPSTMKLKGFGERLILKQAMHDLLPPAIFRRKNMGLEMPHSGWFLNEFRDIGMTYFQKERVGRTGLLEPGKVASLWEEHLTRKRDHGRALWCILNLVLWFEMFVASSDYKQYLSPPS
jgi:asparagine synthase (glutamine-hydrolysing)